MGTPPGSFYNGTGSRPQLANIYPLGYSVPMEPTVTNTPTPTPKPSVLSRLRGLSGGTPTDGTLGAKIKAEHLRGLDAASLSGGIGAWQRAGGEIR